MSQPTSGPRWGRFGLRLLFTLVLIVAAYCGGYMQRAHEVQQLAEERAALVSRNAELERDLLLKRVEESGHITLEVTSEKSETPDGRVVRIDPSTGAVWIDRGAADGLRRQQTFAVYDKGETDFWSAKPKGEIEITSFDQPHLARARVVSADLSNPVLVDDVVFSPTWQPGQPLHFALAGKLDYNDDGQADNQLIKDLIKVNGGILDAEVDPQGRRTGTISIQTRYLIVGDPPGGKPAPQAADAYTNLLREADEFGIEKISIKGMFEMGYDRETRAQTQLHHAAAGRFRPRGPSGVDR
ncbi:MAG: hypothetical protein RIC55_18980 [Pirellulaceae bacterium]